MKKINRDNFVLVRNKLNKRTSPHNLLAFRSKGFSIIEVLIFTLLSSIVLIGMSYATLLSVANSRASQNKTRSTRYIGQAQEWLKGQKEIDWNRFVAALNEETYCINDIPLVIEDLSLVVGACESDDFNLNNFKRELIITDINSDQTEVTYTVKTYWHNGPNINTSQVSSLLAQWE